jgi:hypothetical protein
MSPVQQDDVVAQPAQQHRGRGPSAHDHNLMTDKHETTLHEAKLATLAESW